jgi:hypothetical protein
MPIKRGLKESDTCDIPADRMKMRQGYRSERSVTMNRWADRSDELAGNVVRLKAGSIT